MTIINEQLENMLLNSQDIHQTATFLPFFCHNQNIVIVETIMMKEQLYKEMIAMHHEGEEAYRGLRALLYEDPIFEALNDN